jgi:hypothetical protein
MTSTGNYVRSDNTTSAAYPSSGNGSTLPEQYTALHPSSLSSTSPIQAGQATILRSSQTGQYCRLQPLASNATQLGMVCDLASPTGSTAFIYTGSGLSTSDGVPLVSTGPGAPLLLVNTTAITPGVPDGQLAFRPAGKAACAVTEWMVLC